MARRKKVEDTALTDTPESQFEDIDQGIQGGDAATAEGEGTDGPKKTVICPDKSRYQRVRSSTGAVSANCGDPVATGLQGVDLPQVYNVAAELLDISVDDLIEKYGHLNAGQQRMNVGNRIRGHFKKLEKAQEGSSETAVATFLEACDNVRTVESQKEFGKPQVQKDAEKEAKAFANAQAS